MNREDIFKKIKLIINEISGKDEIYFDSFLSSDNQGLDMSSMDIVHLIVNVEEEFDIIIDFDVLFVTVGDIVNEVEKLIKSDGM